MHNIGQEILVSCTTYSQTQEQTFRSLTTARCIKKHYVLPCFKVYALPCTIDLIPTAHKPIWLWSSRHAVASFFNSTSFYDRQYYASRVVAWGAVGQNTACVLNSFFDFEFKHRPMSVVYPAQASVGLLGLTHMCQEAFLNATHACVWAVADSPSYPRWQRFVHTHWPHIKCSLQATYRLEPLSWEDLFTHMPEGLLLKKDFFESAHNHLWTFSCQSGKILRHVVQLLCQLCQVHHPHHLWPCIRFHCPVPSAAEALRDLGLSSRAALW